MTARNALSCFTISDGSSLRGLLVTTRNSIGPPARSIGSRHAPCPGTIPGNGKRTTSGPITRAGLGRRRSGSTSILNVPIFGSGVAAEEPPDDPASARRTPGCNCRIQAQTPNCSCGMPEVCLNCESDRAWRRDRCNSRSHHPAYRNRRMLEDAPSEDRRLPRAGPYQSGGRVPDARSR